MGDEPRVDRCARFWHAEAHIETLLATATEAQTDLDRVLDSPTAQERIAEEEIVELREEVLTVQAHLQTMQSQLSELTARD